MVAIVKINLRGYELVSLTLTQDYNYYLQH